MVYISTLLLGMQGKEVPEHIQDCLDSYEYVTNYVEELLEELKS